MPRRSSERVGATNAHGDRRPSASGGVRTTSCQAGSKWRSYHSTYSSTIARVAGWTVTSSTAPSPTIHTRRPSRRLSRYSLPVLIGEPGGRASAKRLAEGPGDERDRAVARLDQLAHRGEAVKHAAVADVVDGDAGVAQPLGVRGPLVAQRVEAGGDDQRGRHPGQGRRQQRRHAPVARVLGLVEVVRLEPAHAGAGEPVALGE